MNETACPDAEVLAALADRETSSPQREGLIRHITQCRDCYLVFVETVRLLDAARSDQPGTHGSPKPIHSAEVPQGGAARAWPWVIPAAAAALLAVGIGTALREKTWGPQTSPVAQREAPLPARPNELLPAPADLRAGAAIPGDTPAWIRGAPWNSASQTRNSFASAPSNRRAFVLGMHLASLDRACREPASTAREVAIGEIDRSLRAADSVAAGERRRLVDQGRSQNCHIDSRIGEAAMPWLSLGRALEDWRIAAIERNPSALDPERARNLGRLIAMIDLEKPARVLGARLAQDPRLRERESWDSLVDGLAELIELLCV